MPNLNSLCVPEVWVRRRGVALATIRSAERAGRIIRFISNKVYVLPKCDALLLLIEATEDPSIDNQTRVELFDAVGIVIGKS